MNIDDPVIQDIRRYREEHAARFNHDIRAIVADLKRSEAERDRSRSPLLVPPESPAPLPSASVQRARFVRR